jgi:DeoR family transcriptional regulator, fructose operon transcriptional repressor
MTMNPETRRQQILDLLNQASGGPVTIPDLSRALGVSEMTVRRDLERLEEQEQIRRIYGGALSANRMGVEQALADRAGQASPQKVEIGRMAARLVQDGDTILLDSGTTTRQVARNLGALGSLTVVTNNIPITEELEAYPQIKIILLGGQMKHREKCTIGPIARQALELFRVDTAFLGTAGFSIADGITDIDMAEVEIKQTMIRAARRVILVCDSSKYGTPALIRVAPLSAVHILISDDDLPEDAIREMESLGIEVITPHRFEEKSKESAS